MEGIIKKLNEKGFGFITPEGEDKDVFFHRNDLVDADFDSLNEGDKVTFEKEDSEKGPKAVGVTLV
jgi:cold shock protein